MTDYSVNTVAGETFPLVQMHAIAQQAVATVRPIVDQVPHVARQCWDLKRACQARVSAAAFRIEYLRVLNALPSGSDGDLPPVLMVMNGRLPDPLVSLIQACTTDVRILLRRDASEITTRQYRCLYWACVNRGLDGHPTMPVMTRLIGALRQRPRRSLRPFARLIDQKKNLDPSVARSFSGVMSLVIVVSQGLKS
jgi:hypothetical protein